MERAPERAEERGPRQDEHEQTGRSHAQWSGEMERLLGHARARTAGVDGHTSFEVFLTGGPYGDGKWVLLDHDISTVIFNPEGTALLSIDEVKADLKRIAVRSVRPEYVRDLKFDQIYDVMIHDPDIKETTFTLREDGKLVVW